MTCHRNRIIDELLHQMGDRNDRRVSLNGLLLVLHIINYYLLLISY